MNVLFLSALYPNDLGQAESGGFRRMSAFLAGIGRVAHIDLLLYTPPEADTSPAATLRLEHEIGARWGQPVRLTLCRRRPPPRTTRAYWRTYGAPALSLSTQPRFHAFAGPEQLHAFEAALDRRPDAVFALNLTTMMPVLRTRRPLPPVYLDLDNIEHTYFLRSIPQPPQWRTKPLLYLQLPALFLAEHRAIRQTRKTFVCSALDQRYLSRLGLGNVEVVPNAVAIPPAPRLGEDPILLFVGTYHYEPNVAAAEHLLGAIWPRIRAALPEARLLLAGPNPELVPSHRHPPAGAEFTGYVPDLAALYARARVVCCPVLSGGGTRLKIIEAAAHGKAIVSTRIGAEGIELEGETEILLRDDPASFAAACVDLLGDTERCRRLGQAARERAVSLYDRERIVARIAGLFGELGHAPRR